MKKAFVFGKFLPFHKGHEAMIQFALTHCDFLSVLVCGSDKEHISTATRKDWIDQTFESFPNIEVKIFEYSENDLPNTSESSEDVSKVWSEIFMGFFADYDLVITSEKYGDYVASFMGIKHLPFDLLKQVFPISASVFRKDIFAKWEFLPSSVKPYFAIKIVILGTESTGKTTLTEQLARHFGCTAISEAGRDIIANSNSFQWEDLHHVANEHARRIDAAVCGDSPLVIIDTDVNTTKSYAEFIFGKKLKVAKKILHANKADLYLYLNKDVEYVQDGTRLSEADRNALDLSHRKILSREKIKFVEISGTWDQRFEKAVIQIHQVIAAQIKRHQD